MLCSPNTTQKAWHFSPWCLHTNWKATTGKQKKKKNTDTEVLRSCGDSLVAGIISSIGEHCLRKSLYRDQTKHRRCSLESRGLLSVFTELSDAILHSSDPTVSHKTATLPHDAGNQNHSRRRKVSLWEWEIIEMIQISVYWVLNWKEAELDADSLFRGYKTCVTQHYTWNTVRCEGLNPLCHVTGFTDPL